MTQTVGKVTADRELQKLAHVLGVKQNLKEETMQGKQSQGAATPPQSPVITKKGGAPVRGTNMQEMIDGGDYGTQAEAVAAQASDTRAPGAPATTSMSGSQVQSVNLPNDKSMSVASKEQLKAAVAQIAAGNADALRFITAQDDPVNADRPTEGPEIGEYPEPAPAPAEAPDAAPDAAPAAAPGQPVSATDVAVQSKIKELSDSIAKDKAVMDALQDIAQDAGVATTAAQARPLVREAKGPFPYNINPPNWIPKEMADFWRDAVERAVEEQGEDPGDPNIYGKVVSIYKALVRKHGGPDFPISIPETSIKARGYEPGSATRGRPGRHTLAPAAPGPDEVPTTGSRRHAAVGNEPAANEQSPKVPHASADISDETVSPNPDTALSQEARGKSGTEYKGVNMPVEYRPDEDYPLTKGAVRTHLRRQASALKARQVPETKALALLANSRINKAWERVEAARQLSEQARQQVFAEVKKLVGNGATLPSALATIRGKNRELVANSTQAARVFGDSMKIVRAMLKNAGAEDPDKMNATTQHPEYTGSDAGDKKPDDISDGTDTTITSPATEQVAGGADAYLDGRHREDVAGSSVASRVLSPSETKKLLGVLQRLDGAHDKIEGVRKTWEKNAALQTTRRVMAESLGGLTANMKATGDAIEKLMRLSQHEKTAKSVLRERLVQAVQQAKAQITEADRVLSITGSLSAEVDARNQRLARVGPVLKTALLMMQKGHLDLVSLPMKMASFIKMSTSEFGKVAEMVAELQPAGSSNQRTGARRLPFASSGAGGGDTLSNELDGVFE